MGHSLLPHYLYNPLNTFSEDSAFNARSQKYTILLQFPTHVAKDAQCHLVSFFIFLKLANLIAKTLSFHG
jgi:hypothetical protein